MWREPRDVQTGPVPVSNIGVGHNGGATYPSSGYDGVYQNYFEVISSDDNAKNRSDKACEHYKFTCNAGYGSIGYISASASTPDAGPWWSWTNTNPGGVYSSLSISGEHFGPAKKPLGGLVSLYGTEGGATARRCMPWIPIDQYAGRCLAALYPGIRPELSLINSLIELKDFKSTARGVVSARKRISAIQTKLENAVFPTETLRRVLMSAIKRRLTLNQILKLASENYLQWQFAIAPLARDIESVKTAIRGARQSVAKLLADEGKLRRTHFSVPLAECTGGSETYYCYGPSSWGVVNQFYGRREVNYTNAKFTVSLAYSYKLDEWQKQHLLPLGYLDSLGVFWNPAIIWNALPWSFVVDWVMGVGSWLDQFKTRNIEPTIHVARCCISARAKRTVTLRLATLDHPAFGGGTGETLVSSVTEDAYFRQPHNANFVRSIQSSGLNLKEFSLAAALGLARLPR